MWGKTIKHAFSMFYILIKHDLLTNLSARWVVLSILQIKLNTSKKTLQKYCGGLIGASYNPRQIEWPSDFCAINEILWIYFTLKTPFPCSPCHNQSMLGVPKHLCLLYGLCYMVSFETNSEGKWEQNAWKKREEDVRNSE